MLDEQEYRQLFDRTEGFLAMPELNFAGNSEVAPEYRRDRSHWIGRIGHSEGRLDDEAGLAPDTVREVHSQHERWWPVVGVMFCGDGHRAETAATLWSENVIKVRGHRF